MFDPQIEKAALQAFHSSKGRKTELREELYPERFVKKYGHLMRSRKGNQTNPNMHKLRNEKPQHFPKQSPSDGVSVHTLPQICPQPRRNPTGQPAAATEVVNPSLSRPDPRRANLDSYSFQSDAEGGSVLAESQEQPLR